MVLDECIPSRQVRHLVMHQTNPLNRAIGFKLPLNLVLCSLVADPGYEQSLVGITINARIRLWFVLGKIIRCFLCSLRITSRGSSAGGASITIFQVRNTSRANIKKKAVQIPLLQHVTFSSRISWTRALLCAGVSAFVTGGAYSGSPGLAKD